jgi:hypothetical protein
MWKVEQRETRKRGPILSENLRRKLVDMAKEERDKKRKLSEALHQAYMQGLQSWD